jgi:hypothetical protein
MARYSALLGHRIEVHYHAGETVLPATGTLSADSGRSIFLEESVRQQGEIKTFRWEIPYNNIVRLAESAMRTPVDAIRLAPELAPVGAKE